METPTREDIQFYGDCGDYWKTVFARALAEERITKDDRDLILQFVSEHRAFVGISRGHNKTDERDRNLGRDLKTCSHSSFPALPENSSHSAGGFNGGCRSYDVG